MTSFTYDQLIACGEGKLFDKGGPPLPSPPMLMFDAITKISSDGGEFKKGSTMDNIQKKKEMMKNFTIN